MQIGRPIILSCCLLILIATVFVVAANKACSQTGKTFHQPTFHETSPTEPLPATLAPQDFRYNRAAFVAYAVAGRIRETLYQVPCYCHCDREAGHQSLLDCFTSKHGAMCTICQKEAIFCYQSVGKHQDPRQIRNAMARGKAFELNLDRNVKHLYKNFAQSPQ